MNTEENKVVETEVAQETEKTEQTEVETKVEGTEDKVETPKATEKKEERTYTQAEYEAGVKKGIASKMKDLPSKEEFAEYKAWKEGQEQRAEDERKRKEQDEYKDRKIILLESEAKKEFHDYLIHEVSKLDGDFKENLETYLKENEQYSKNKNISTGIRNASSEAPKENGVREILKQRNPRAFS